MSADQTIREASAKLDKWVEDNGFQGWDPYDALNSRVLKLLTFGSRLLGVGGVQLLRRSPVNLRPLLGIEKGYNPKGMGLFFASYLRRYQLTAEPNDLRRACFFVEWLAQHVSPGYSGPCWGYNFDWPNRSLYAPAGTPTVVNTVFIADALLDGYELIGRNDWLEEARGACNFILNDLNRHEDHTGTCFSYTPIDRRRVHNANVLAGALLARVARLLGEGDMLATARKAIAYTAARQRADGSWPYGVAFRDGWVDNFHTGYVLVAVKRASDWLQSGEFDEAIRSGYRFWKRNMFLPDGTPKYYPRRVYPIDVHSIAQAILTFLEFSDWDPGAMDWAWRVALWGIENMQDPTGYFHYQIWRGYRIRIPYMRWSQAWMQRGLTELLYVKGQGLTPQHR